MFMVLKSFWWTLTFVGLWSNDETELVFILSSEQAENDTHCFSGAAAGPGGWAARGAPHGPDRAVWAASQGPQPGGEAAGPSDWRRREDHQPEELAEHVQGAGENTHMGCSVWIIVPVIRELFYTEAASCFCLFDWQEELSVALFHIRDVSCRQRDIHNRIQQQQQLSENGNSAISVPNRYKHIQVNYCWFICIHKKILVLITHGDLCQILSKAV